MLRLSNFELWISEIQACFVLSKGKQVLMWASKLHELENKRLVGLQLHFLKWIHNTFWANSWMVIFRTASELQKRRFEPMKYARFWCDGWGVNAEFTKASSVRSIRSNQPFLRSDWGRWKTFLAQQQGIMWTQAVRNERCLRLVRFDWSCWPQTSWTLWEVAYACERSVVRCTGQSRWKLFGLFFGYQQVEHRWMKKLIRMMCRHLTFNSNDWP